MAFMMPVVKNDWDIYKSNRTRRLSECSNTGTCSRSRKVSECKSEGGSLSTSPPTIEYVPTKTPVHTKSAPANITKQQTGFSRSSSRASEGSLQSPMRSSCSSPPTKGSDNNLNSFHNKLLNKLKKSFKNKDSDSERTSS